MAELDIDEARRLISAIVDLSQMADRVLPRRASPLVERLRAHLGIDDTVPNTAVTLQPIEHANLQLAFDALRDAATRSPTPAAAHWTEIGLPADIGNYSGISLAAMVAGSWHGPGETARQYVAVEVSATETIRCLRAGIVLAQHDSVPVALMLHTSERHRPELVVEVVAPDQATADAFLQQVRDLMDRHNVLRGKVLTFSFDHFGGFGLTFTALPAVARSQVILPAWQLDAIDEHAIGVSDVGAELLAAGQHLKRGLLLYGPPGTGKSHTVAYLVGQMTGRTTVVLSGASVEAVGQAGTIARAFAPATIVIEDVDLIGMDRGLPGGEHNALLFQLLNEMDGLAPDADVLFILTTNRADLLEPALAARPGRIDQAIEIGLPDDAGRRALFELYLPDAVNDDGEDAALDVAVARTAGAAAAYIKELSRRAALHVHRHGATLADALTHVVDHMDATATPVLRAALAAHASHTPDR